MQLCMHGPTDCLQAGVHCLWDCSAWCDDGRTDIQPCSTDEGSLHRGDHQGVRVCAQQHRAAVLWQGQDLVQAVLGVVDMDSAVLDVHKVQLLGALVPSLR